MAQDWEYYPVSHGYITDYQGANTDTPHYAFDIAAPMDTPFFFPVNGTIEQADYAVWGGKQGGGEVFVKPDNNAPEEYVYHLDQIFVKPGDHIQAGQVVGLSGGQNSGGTHNTDPYWSTGPHIHVGEFDNWTTAPDGSTKPYGANPQYIVDGAKSVSLLTGGVTKMYDAGQQLGSAVGTINNAINNVPIVGGLNQIGNVIGNIGSFFNNGGLQRVGIFAIGGLIIIGGFFLLANKDDNGKSTIQVVESTVKKAATVAV